MKNRKDNKGFTLVEVIIAVVILGIVFSPLLKNFIESAKLNNRARKILNATTMAQNIMEGISAYSAEDIIKSLDSAPDGEAVSVVPTNMSIVAHGEIDPTTGALIRATSTSGTQANSNPATGILESKYCTYSVSSNGIVRPNKVIPNTFGTNPSVPSYSYAKYQFYLQGVTVNGATSASNVTYDMVVTVDTNGHDVSNSKETAHIASMNGICDFVWQDNKIDREDAVNDMNLSTGADKTNINSEIKHTINVVLNKDASDTTVKVQHTYDTATYGSKSIDEASYFSKNKTSQDPRNVYIYYWPNYTTSAYYDEINITSNLPTRTNVYLIRMAVENDIISDGVTYYAKTSESNENNYRATINVDGAVVLYTNVAYYLCHGYREAGVGHDWSESMLNSRIAKTQTNGAVLHLNLSETETENRIYNVTLDVYDNGGVSATGIIPSKKVATFTGGTTE